MSCFRAPWRGAKGQGQLEAVGELLRSLWDAMEGSKGPGAAGSVGEVFCSLWDAMEESEGPGAAGSLGRLLGSRGGGHKRTQEGKDVFSDLAWACKGPVRTSPSQSGWLIPSKDSMTQANTVPRAWWASLRRQSCAVSPHPPHVQLQHRQ